MFFVGIDELEKMLKTTINSTVILTTVITGFYEQNLVYASFPNRQIQLKM